MAPAPVIPLSASCPSPRPGVPNASYASSESRDESHAPIYHMYYHSSLPPEIMQQTVPIQNSLPIDYRRELRIRGVFEHNEGDEILPSDWDTLQSYLTSDDSKKALDSLYFQWTRNLLDLMEGTELNGILPFLLSKFRTLYENDDSVRVCIRKEWKTMPLPWRGGDASDLPTLCPDLTFGHGAGADLMHDRLQCIMSPFFTPVLEDPGLTLPCVTVQAKGDDDEQIRDINQQAGATMLRNMAELSLTAGPTQLLRQMISLENRVSVLTVSVLQSSLVLTCHWLMRDPGQGTASYHSRDMQSWDLNNLDQKLEGLRCIFNAIRWVLYRNHSWVIDRLYQLM